MIVLNTDLDNTIIYSYKHDIGIQKRNVEMYRGREVSFITDKTFELLKRVKNEMLIVPTSTRTVEQYKRIDLGVGNLKYALVCNGGILLVDGKVEKSWYQESLRLISKSMDEISSAMKILENDTRRKFGLRLIESLFVFTKCSEPENVVLDLKRKLNLDLVDVFCNGEKVYVVPVELNKGKAIQRFREVLNPEYVIAAGDSEFDISMIEKADKGLVPYGFRDTFGVESDIIEAKKNRIFSEMLLEECISIAATISYSSV